MSLNSSNSDFFKSNGKIMLTGEYLVLKGAWSLSLPTIKGQTLKVLKKKAKPSLSWKTNMMGNYWFDARFSVPEFAIGNTNDFPIAQQLREILMAAKEINPDFLSEDYAYEVTSNIEFHIDWGLGSSSSLLVNIASWAGIDPFDLHFKVSKGSGYDIAVSGSASPVLYRIRNGKPEFEEVSFNPEFKDKLYFVYLGKKKSSRLAVEEFNKIDGDLSSEVQEINRITSAILRNDSFHEFIRLIRKHEKILTSILNIPAPGSSRFYDFNGTVKSLGAWGGDFVLLASDYPVEYINSYLRRKEFHTWFQFSDFIMEINRKKHA